jgi:hypothetical protein
MTQGKKDVNTTKGEYYQGGLIARLPELGELQYLAEMWDDLGRCQSGGFGVSVTGWSDVKAYLDVNGAAKWEGQIIHAMSKVFVESRNMFADELCEPPYLYGGFDFATLARDAASRRNKRA